MAPRSAKRKSAGTRKALGGRRSRFVVPSDISRRLASGRPAASVKDGKPGKSPSGLGHDNDIRMAFETPDERASCREARCSPQITAPYKEETVPKTCQRFATAKASEMALENHSIGRGSRNHRRIGRSDRRPTTPAPARQGDHPGRFCSGDATLPLRHLKHGMGAIP